MPRADLFSQLGLFVERDFLDSDLCSRVIAETACLTKTGGTIWRKGYTAMVADEAMKRREETTALTEATKSLVRERLLARVPALERHFEVTLAGCQPPRFLRYKTGDFYGPHFDTIDEPDAPEETRERRVSFVVFLNAEGEEPDDGSYCGGSLTFYGLVDDPFWNAFGLPLVGETGMLIAFRPTLLHEVRPVTFGERFAISGWYI